MYRNFHLREEINLQPKRLLNKKIDFSYSRFEFDVPILPARLLESRIEASLEKPYYLKTISIPYRELEDTPIKPRGLAEFSNPVPLDKVNKIAYN